MMNSLHRLFVITIVLCSASASWALDSFSFLGTRADTRASDVLNATVEWGTDELNGNYAQRLVRYTTINGVTTILPMSGTFIPNLKPRGGGSFPVGATGLVAQIWPLPNGDVLFSTQIVPGNSNYLFKMRGATGTVGNNAAHNNLEAVLNMGERGSGTVADIRALHNRSIVIANVNNATVLFYGEYNVSSQSPHVGLWKSTDLGDNWTKVVEWNTVGHQVAHMHGVVQNPYNKWIYLLFGDVDTENGIIAWDGVSPPPPDNTPLANIGNYPGWKALTGTKWARTGDLVFTPPPESKCVWLPDVDTLNPGETLQGQRANYDLTGLEATGVVPYVNGIPPILGVRSNTSHNIYWASFRNAGISVPPENKLHVWKSVNSGLTWQRVDGANITTLSSFTAMPQNLWIKEKVTPAGAIDNLFFTMRIPRIDPNGGFSGSSALFTNTALVANNDAYTTTANEAYSQVFDLLSANGVRLNDLPTGWPTGLNFSIVSPIVRTSGTGTGIAKLTFRDTGGFYVLLQSNEATPALRRSSKLGTFEFSYKMSFNGLTSEPATVTLTVQ